MGFAMWWITAPSIKKSKFNCFHWFRSAKVSGYLDLISPYHKIRLTERSKPVTAFATD
jgi:hypothetical protein